MISNSLVLISWIALQNDPFESKPDNDGKLIPGPTLTVLFDEESCFRGKIGDTVILFREGSKEQEVVERTKVEIQSRQKDMRISTEVWKAMIPPIIKPFFSFLKKSSLN